MQLDDRRRLRLAADVCKGMHYLHSCKPPIIHRDLKSPNLLVDKDFTVKVGLGQDCWPRKTTVGSQRQSRLIAFQALLQWPWQEVNSA